MNANELGLWSLSDLEFTAYYVSHDPRYRGFKSWVQYSDRQLKFLTEEIIDAKHFNFAIQFPKNGRLPAPHFVFLVEAPLYL